MNETDLSIKKMSEDIAEIKLKLENHIGDGGDSHFEVQEGLPGFINFDTMNASLGKRKRLEDNLDILSLPAGSWEIATDVNTPNGDGGIWIVDVSVSIQDSKRKQFVICRSGTRRMYYRNYHTGGVINDIVDGWCRIPLEYTLWEGEEGRKNAILKLKTRTGLYDSFRFEYRCVGNISSTTCPTAHDSFVLSGINIVNDEIESGM